jgi:cytoskeletal protein CcmA (bactofilin family)
MFKALKRGSSDKEGLHHPTVIGKSAVIVGNLVSQDQVQLNGHVVGNIDVNGSPHAQLSVMRQGHVEGDINARQASVNGVVNGNIASNGRVELHAGADVKGNISYATMAIEHGAKLYGIMTSKDAEQP